jgi:hypothetical protein
MLARARSAFRRQYTAVSDEVLSFVTASGRQDVS